MRNRLTVSLEKVQSGEKYLYVTTDTLVLLVNNWEHKIANDTRAE